MKDKASAENNYWVYTSNQLVACKSFFLNARNLLSNKEALGVMSVKVIKCNTFRKPHPLVKRERAKRKDSNQYNNKQSQIGPINALVKVQSITT